MNEDLQGTVLSFHMLGEMETVGHAAGTQQFQFTGGCKPVLHDREEGKQKNMER